MISSMARARDRSSPAKAPLVLQNRACQHDFGKHEGNLAAVAAFALFVVRVIVVQCDPAAGTNGLEGVPGDFPPVFRIPLFRKTGTGHRQRKRHLDLAAARPKVFSVGWRIRRIKNPAGHANPAAVRPLLQYAFYGSLPIGVPCRHRRLRRAAWRCGDSFLANGHSMNKENGGPDRHPGEDEDGAESAGTGQEEAMWFHGCLVHALFGSTPRPVGGCHGPLLFVSLRRQRPSRSSRWETYYSRSP